MKNPYKIFLGAVFGLFFFINIITLNDGHNWGDDFAQYIQHAVNLLQHKPYASGISYDLRVVPPPGFPLLLSSIIYWSGLNFKVLKSLNILLWALGACVVYGIVLSYLDIFWAAMITAWFLSSPIFFFFKQNVLSDIPFMVFVLLSIWTFVRSEEYQQKGLINSSRTFLWASVFCMSYALLIRWAGVSLILAAVVYYSVIKKEWQRSLGFILGGLTAWFVAVQCGCLAMGYVDHTTSALFQNTFLISWFNLGLTFQNILNLFITDDKFFLNLITPSNATAISILIALLCLAMTGVFLYRCYQRKISVMGCFTYFYLMGVILWPINAGTRYLLPVMVPLAVYLVKSFKPAWRKLAAFIFLGLIIQNVFVIASHFRFNDDAIDRPEVQEMVQWVQLHITPEDNYMFAKPRALGLFTHRMGHNFGAYPQDVKNWYRRIKPLHINYLIVDKGFSQFSRFDNFRLRVDNYDLYINIVWKNSFYKIFKVTVPAHE